MTVWRRAIVNKDLWRHQILKTRFFGLRSRLGGENVLKQQFLERNYKNNFFEENLYHCKVISRMNESIENVRSQKQNKW